MAIFRPACAILAAALILAAPLSMLPQAPAAYGEAGLQELNESGRIIVQGRAVPYLIRHLPLDSFPGVPLTVEAELARRGCLIPQTYEAHQPENIVHGSFERPGSSDWAALCSTHGTVSLLVFFASRSGEPPFTLASAPELQRLQPELGSDSLGFDWGIDAAAPEDVREAQIGLDPRPPMIDHDAVADSTVEHGSVYHFYANGAWSLLDLPLR